jgi:4-hydroxy-tetrahydrodipicolinate reductase
MKIALIGNGKMGKAIADLAIKKGHSVSVIMDNESDWENQADQLSHCDVAIEFTTPQTVVTNLLRCFDAGLPVITGTTGWTNDLEAVTKQCTEKGGSLLYASNFSLGMNILFEINRKLAQMMAGYPMYKVDITETHHIHKLDKPSGTAISLANDIIAENHSYQAFNLENDLEKSICIHSIREGEVTGIHTVKWNSEIDCLSLKHEAHNRHGLAIGALLAAEWIIGKTGIFTMRDVLHD